MPNRGALTSARTCDIERPRRRISTSTSSGPWGTWATKVVCAVRRVCVRVGHCVGHGSDRQGRDNPSLWHLGQVPRRIKGDPIGALAAPDDVGECTAHQRILHHARRPCRLDPAAGRRPPNGGRIWGGEDRRYAQLPAREWALARALTDHRSGTDGRFEGSVLIAEARPGQNPPFGPRGTLRRGGHVALRKPCRAGVSYSRPCSAGERRASCCTSPTEHPSSTSTFGAGRGEAFTSAATTTMRSSPWPGQLARWKSVGESVARRRTTMLSPF